MARRVAPIVGLLLVALARTALAQTPIADRAAHWCSGPDAACDTEPVAATPAPAGVNAQPVNGGSDKRFPLVLGGFITAASADLAVSMYQIGRGTAREAAFGSRWQDSPVPFAVSKSAMAALFTLGVQRLHKDRPKTALILGISATVVESLLVVRAARISPGR
jgi:hypothetical protein